MTQETLDFGPTEDPPPTPTRPWPKVWIRRLVVVRDLRSEDPAVVRDLRFRRGLNIIWAPPLEPPEGAPLNEGGLSGHTAGKTTLCRLIRHVLGEQGLLDGAARRRLRQAFPHGWVLAEVLIEERVWTVGRPFMVGPHPFCIPDEGVEAVWTGDRGVEYPRFLDALDAATAATLPARHLALDDDPIRWAHLLSWIARDQECAYRDAFEWRATETEAESPATSADDRQRIVRSVLGMISDEEGRVQSRVAGVRTQRRELVGRLPLVQHQAEIDFRRLRGDSSGLAYRADEPLALAAQRKELAEAIARVEAELRALDTSSPALVALAARVTEAEAVETAAVKAVGYQEAIVAMYGGVPETPGELPNNALSDLPAPRGRCNQLISVAKENRCPAWEEIPSDLGAERSARMAEHDSERERKAYDAAARVLVQKRELQTEAERLLRVANDKLQQARDAREATRRSLGEERERLNQRFTQLGYLERSAAEATEQVKRIKDLEGEIEDATTRQETLRKASARALRDFSQNFNRVVRALLGDGVSGEIKPHGSGLRAVIDRRGERISAAINAVKVIAFDLAALTESLAGRGHFPGILIHDGPREADLALDIYERLFAFVRELETATTGEPSFQYIVTTTTAPPKDLQTAPWLRLRLAGTPATERLLGLDL
jgi:hypothetical protein